MAKAALGSRNLRNSLRSRMKHTVTANKKSWQKSAGKAPEGNTKLILSSTKIDSEGREYRRWVNPYGDEAGGKDGKGKEGENKGLGGKKLEGLSHAEVGSTVTTLQKTMTGLVSQVSTLLKRFQALSKSPLSSPFDSSHAMQGDYKKLRDSHNPNSTRDALQFKQNMCTPSLTEAEITEGVSMCGVSHSNIGLDSPIKSMKLFGEGTPDVTYHAILANGTEGIFSPENNVGSAMKQFASRLVAMALKVNVPNARFGTYGVSERAGHGEQIQGLMEEREHNASPVGFEKEVKSLKPLLGDHAFNSIAMFDMLMGVRRENHDILLKNDKGKTTYSLLNSGRKMGDEVDSMFAEGNHSTFSADHARLLDNLSDDYLNKIQKRIGVPVDKIKKRRDIIREGIHKGHTIHEIHGTLQGKDVEYSRRFNAEAFENGRIKEDSLQPLGFMESGINISYHGEIEGDGRVLFKPTDAKPSSPTALGMMMDKDTDSLNEFLSTPSMDLRHVTQSHREELSYKIAEALGDKDIIDSMPKVTMKQTSEHGDGAAIEWKEDFVPGISYTDGELSTLFAKNSPEKLAKLAAFDDIIGSGDRHEKNLGFDGKGNLMLIDNGLSLPKETGDADVKKEIRQPISDRTSAERGKYATLAQVVSKVTGQDIRNHPAYQKTMQTALLRGDEISDAIDSAKLGASPEAHAEYDGIKEGVHNRIGMLLEAPMPTSAKASETVKKRAFFPEGEVVKDSNGKELSHKEAEAMIKKMHPDVKGINGAWTNLVVNADFKKDPSWVVKAVHKYETVRNKTTGARVPSPQRILSQKETERVKAVREEGREERFARVANIRKKYPDIIKGLERHVTKANREEAVASLIMATTGLRVGGDGETLLPVLGADGNPVKNADGRTVKEAVKTYGVTELEARHVSIGTSASGKEVANFDFIGKKGGRNVATVENPHVVSFLKERLAQAGNDPTAKLFSTTSAKVNKFLTKVREIPKNTTAKDFRTHIGTAEAILRIGEFVKEHGDTIHPSQLDGFKRIVGLAAGKRLNHQDAEYDWQSGATALNNYIDPAVFDAIKTDESAPKLAILNKVPKPKPIEAPAPAKAAEEQAMYSDYTAGDRVFQSGDIEDVQYFSNKQGASASFDVGIKGDGRGIAKPDRYADFGTSSSTPSNREVLAYRLSRALGVNMIPQTVIKSMEDPGHKLYGVGTNPPEMIQASVQKKVDNLTTLAEHLGNQKPQEEFFNRLKQNNTEDEIGSAVAFDDIIGNADRNVGNIGLDGNGKMVLIDHAESNLKDFGLTPEGQHNLSSVMERGTGDNYRGTQAYKTTVKRAYQNKDKYASLMKEHGVSDSEVDDAMARIDHLFRNYVYFK